VARQGPVRAVLFDLDDTLFDHRHCAGAALRHVFDVHQCAACVSFADFEAAHAAHLEELHHEVLAGRLGIDEARRERFRRLFAGAGVAAGAEDVHRAALAYRRGYLAARRAVAGAADLVCRIRALARVGIVSNNLLEEQREKLRACGLDACIDVLVVSEEAGVSKPDPRIFRLALERLGCGPADAVMIGDSWSADVRGALAAGIRAIWFNPAGKPAPEPQAGVVELRALEPVERVVEVVMRRGAAPPAPRPAPRRRR
jgi:putative hydrolase of the HAD superfamily